MVLSWRGHLLTAGCMGGVCHTACVYEFLPFLQGLFFWRNPMMVRKPPSPFQSQGILWLGDLHSVSPGLPPVLAPWSEVIDPIQFSTGRWPLAVCMAQYVPGSRPIRHSFFSWASVARARGLGTCGRGVGICGRDGGCYSDLVSLVVPSLPSRSRVPSLPMISANTCCPCQVLPTSWCVISPTGLTVGQILPPSCPMTWTPFFVHTWYLPLPQWATIRLWPRISRMRKFSTQSSTNSRRGMVDVQLGFQIL